ncbi:MAG: UbiA family prenyltransferase [Candidatus Thermoplasmatota archaeon]|nr:UbiA family prenyltransferase [Candidatus Thermoplasmatota archaeon]
MNPWIRIIRPINGVMGILATFISGLIGSGLKIGHFILPVSVAALSVFLVTSGGNIINDVVDVETDRINHPRRPLVTGEISVKSAKIAVAVAFILAFVLSAAFVSLLAASVVILAELFLIAYEFRTKKLGLSGNIMISILVGLIFIFGGIAVNSLDRMIILFFMAMLANLSREIIKDIEDINGDTDRITFPKRHGIRFAAYVAASSVIIAVMASYIPYYLKIFGVYYLIPVAISDLMFLVSASLITRSPGSGIYDAITAMILGLVSFAVGGLT